MPINFGKFKITKIREGLLYLLGHIVGVPLIFAVIVLSVVYKSIWIFIGFCIVFIGFSVLWERKFPSEIGAKKKKFDLNRHKDD